MTDIGYLKGRKFFEGKESEIVILVVDDNFINQKVMNLALSKEGHEVDFAKNGFEALMLCDQKVYDILFMDVNMPIIDGFTATRMIREKEVNRGNHTPIIALTGSSSLDEKEKCFDAGMDDFLSKPLDMKILHNVIQKWSQVKKSA